MKKILTALLLCISAFSSIAQDEINTEFISRMNYVFSSLEKNRVPNGLLLDYAMEFADLKSYNGTLTDSNKVNAGLLRDIYTTVAMSAIHTNAGGFYSPDYVDSIWQLQRQPGIITLSGMYYNYARFKDNAVSAGLLTVSSDRFLDKYVSSVWQNPYQTETVFAMTPPLHSYSGKNLQVVMPANLWFTNNAGGVGNMAVNFGDGAGYRSLTAGQVINISYADTGTKTWIFRLTLTNNVVLYSHTEMKIKPEPNASSGSGCASCRYPRPGAPPFLTADNSYLGQAGKGWVTVDYAHSDYKLRKPLIVVEGFDPGYLLIPEQQFGYTSFESFKEEQLRLSGSSLDDLLRGAYQQYDIIYVDWYQGADYLQRNAYLLERVIRWVNEEKSKDGCTEPNVVLGQSMGGVIARWALRDMEKRGLGHQTRLFISWDAPHQGANVPLSYQHAARHANSLFMKTAIPLLLGGNSTVRVVRNGLNLLDYPAPRQMLYNRVLSTGQLSNTDHATWQQELKIMGYPQQCRNVAVSNGSECGKGQGFAAGATLLHLSGRGNTRILTDIIGMLGMPVMAAVLNQPAFALGILPGRNDLSIDIRCEAQPEGSTMPIYKGKITYTKKILWLVNVNATITDRTRNSDATVLAIDGTPGGMYDTRINPQNAFSNWAAKYNLSVYQVPQFNFIPSVSALDIGGGNTVLPLNQYKIGYAGATPPSTPYNTPFANFTTAFNAVAISNGNANNNEGHIQIAQRNGNFVAEELNGNVNVRTGCNAYCIATEIVGNQIVCSSNTFSAPLIAGATYSWFPTTSSLASFSANNNTLTVTRNGLSKGNITIYVIINVPCGSITLNKNIEIGNSLSSYYVDFWGMPSAIGQGSSFNVHASTNSTNLVWNVGGGQVISGQGTEEAFVRADFLQSTGTDGYLQVLLQAYDACNENSIYASKTATINSGIGYDQTTRTMPRRNPETEAPTFTELKLYPNPASNYFVLELPDNYLNGSIKLLTEQGQLLRKETIVNRLTTFNVQTAPTGVYLVEIATKEGQSEKKKIVVVH